MSNNSYKFLRIYPGLHSDYEIRFKNISFQPLEDSGLENSQISDIIKKLGEFNINEVNETGKRCTLADKPILTTLNQAKDYESFGEYLEPYEQVLFFIANLELGHPPIYENISFHITENGMPLIIGDLRSLRIDPFFPRNIFLSQFHFVQKDDLIQSKLQVIFTSFQSEIYELSSNQFNKQLSNQHLIASLYWYNKACMMSELREEKSAIIYFATAFEAFFNIKGYAKKESLGFAIQRYLGDNDLLRKWTIEFYEARNKIVHGSYIEKSDLKAVRGTNYVHSIIAKRVIQECILRQFHITEGLDYSRLEMDSRYNDIIEIYLTLNNERFKLLLGDKNFTYEEIKENEEIGGRFFKNLLSINVNEELSGREWKKIQKKYIKITKRLAKICEEWLNDAIINYNIPTLLALDRASNTGIHGINPKTEIQEAANLLAKYKPKKVKDISNIWIQTLTHFTHSYQIGSQFFKSSYKNYGLIDIIRFVVVTAEKFNR